MFGIKIISTKKYWEMVEEIGEKAITINLQSEKFGKLEKDCDSLRQQNGDLRKLVGTSIPESASLKDYCVLRTVNYPCDKCRVEKMNCKKLAFADQTICICHKDDKQSIVDVLKPRKRR